jgi:hypothetical protein
MSDENNQTDGKEWRDMLSDIAEKAKEESADSVKKIEELGSSLDAVRLLAAMHANMAIGPAEMMSELTHGSVPVKMEMLAFHLYPFFEHPGKKDITPWHTNECWKTVDNLYDARLRELTFSRIDEKKYDPAQRLMDSIRMQTEIVRGSAYPEQTAEEIGAVQGRFETWFSKRVGIGPTRAKDLLLGIIRAKEESIRSFMIGVREHGKSLKDSWESASEKEPEQRDEAEQRIFSICANEQTAFLFGYVQRLNEVAPDLLPVGREDLSFLDAIPSEEEWEALISLIGLTTENRKQISSPIEVRNRPLFVLPDKSVLLPGISNAMDVLWDRFEEAARANQNFHDRSYQKKKAKWLEEKTTDCLSRIFPADNIFQKLSYLDPDKDDGSTAELDVGVLWGPFLILVEDKAKQFRMESQLGDLGRLRTDIKANVEDAFEQARRAARYIDKVENPEFVEVRTGRKLTIQKDRIRRIYLLTVSQHHLAGLANRLALFEDWGLFTDREYPLSICIADLDTISQFCEGPDVFLHYIEKRLEVQRESVEIVADELDLFGAYLDTRLQAERLWERDGEPVNGIFLSGLQEQFDQWFSYKRGERDKPPEIKLEIPDEIRELLDGLRSGDDDDARWISFALLTMSDRGLGALAHMMQKVREDAPESGMLRRFTHKDGDTVISIVASIDVGPGLLYERTFFRAAVEKYRLKAERSVGIGIMLNDSSRPFHCAVWGEHPWEYDEKMEELIQNEPPFLPVPGQKMPGRNKPCICGSGKKFKKCCLPKIEATRRDLLRS